MRTAAVFLAAFFGALLGCSIAAVSRLTGAEVD